MEKNRFRILLVDDDEDDYIVTRSLVAEFTQAKFELDWAGDFQKGIEAIRRCEHGVYLFDYRLGEHTGLELLAEAQRMGGTIPTILLTGHADREVDVAAMKAGADDYLVKDDVDAPLLERSIRYAIKHKQAEKALRESETRLRTIIEAEPECVKLLSREGVLLEMNPAGLAMIEASSLEQVRGRSVGALVCAPDRPAFEKAVADVFDGKTVSLDFEMVSLKGTIRSMQMHAVPIKDGFGAVTELLSVTRDVTERRRASRKLAEERNLLRTLIDNLPDLISVKDLQCRFLIANAAKAGSLGARDPADVVGKTDFDYYPHDAAEKLFSDDQKIIQSGEPVLNSLEPMTNHHSLLTSKVPLRDSGGGVIGLVTLSRDITEQLNLEAQLRHSQKMESVGQLAAGVAHDFNNILNIILGYTALLMHSEGIAASDQHSLKQIFDAGERAANLTRQLLAFSRKQVIQPRPLNLNEIISNMTTMLHRVLGEHISLQFNYAAGLPNIDADVGMMEQVVINLAVNSRDAMPEGGNLMIGTEAIKVDAAARQQNPEAHEGDFVCLTVADAGSGIAADILPRVFDPFFTTKEVGKGTGLGLATVYGIVKQHQGWIHVETAIGKGTTFKIFLPVSSRDNQARLAQQPSTPAPRGSETILLVEDEPALRELALQLLQDTGYCVFVARSGVAALKIWEEHRDQIDLLFTDMVMPEGISGRELAERLQAQKPGLKVLFTSGYSVDIIRRDFAMRDGLNFLQKPYRQHTLAQAIRDCLDK
jgi:PAS domain S-box-containing protein